MTLNQVPPSHASDDRSGNSPDRRTRLAATRTVLAAERTYAAWMRTGLAALASGLGAKVLLIGVIPPWSIYAIGTTLILFSAFSFAAAVWRNLNSRAPSPDIRLLPAMFLLFVNGMLLAAAFAVLAAFWLARD
jgi:putative membrane protein